MVFLSRPIPSGLALLLSISAQGPVFAAGNNIGYVTEFTADLPTTVYKTTDSDGNVSYSSNLPADTVRIEAIPIGPAPTAAVRQDLRERYDRIRRTARNLSDAREQRQAEREEQEEKRLKRLALQRAARPQVYERRVYVGWRPLWWPLPHAGRHHRPFQKHPSPVVRGPGLAPGIPLGPGRKF